MMSLMLFYFFFQAEDGIRDLTVTGVQTCALPIYDDRVRAERLVEPDLVAGLLERLADRGRRGILAELDPATGEGPPVARSEERRVGKECRSRWSAGP